MAFSPSRILIFGATGNIGLFITNAIVRASPPLKVVVFTSPATATAKADLLGSWKEHGVSVIAGDVNNDEQVRAAYEGVDTVVSALGRGVLDRQIRLIDLAEESESVQWFFPSEYGTDIEHSPKSAHEKPHQLKLAVRKHLREKIKRLKYTFVVTGPYVEMWISAKSGAEEEAGGYDATNKKAVVVGDGEGKVGFITMPDTGKSVVAALRHPEASFNKPLIVQSFVTTPNEVVAEFEKQTGQKWEVAHTSQSRLEELEAAAWRDGSPIATLFTLRRIWAEGGTLYERTSNEDIGLRADDLETLEDTVRKSLAGDAK